jgi:hypothetical protein
MEVEDFYQERTKPLLFRSIDLISKPKSFSKRLDCGRVAGLYRYNPAPSEPDLRLTTHPAQASHKLLIVPECIC